MENYKLEIVKEELQKRRSVKRGNKRLKEYTPWVPSLKTSRGQICTNRQSIIDTATDFYKKLYEFKEHNNINNTSINITPQKESIPLLTLDEIRHGIFVLKIGKSPGEDGITNDVLKALLEPLCPILTKLFNEILFQCKIPTDWETSVITLLYKKGDRLNINNYRPISLLQSIYKLFTNVILTRIKKALEFEQPREQAGFRQGYSTLDHIFTLTQIIERYKEYGGVLYIAFVDYTKAFDSIQHDCLWNAIKEQGIHDRYVNILKEIYSKSKSYIKLERKGKVFNVKRGVRQGDPISPNLFTALLESIFKKLNWSKLGININGESLHHLRFADDIVIITENHHNLMYMLLSLDYESRKCGLHMNPDKTCIMTNSEPKPIEIQSRAIEYIDEYIYLGQNISLKESSTAEVERRVKKAWSAYWSMKHIFKSKINNNLKKVAMDTVVTPTLLYGCQTWPMTKDTLYKLRVFQRRAERSMLGLTLRNRVRNSKIRSMTKITDAAELACRLKWRWAGHLARTTDGRWSEKMLHWYPRERRRGRGRPRRRWRDDIVSLAGTTWTRLAADREKWRTMEEAYVQLWASSA